VLAGVDAQARAEGRGRIGGRAGGGELRRHAEGGIEQHARRVDGGELAAEIREAEAQIDPVGGQGLLDIGLVDPRAARRDLGVGDALQGADVLAGRAAAGAQRLEVGRTAAPAERLLQIHVDRSEEHVGIIAAPGEAAVDHADGVQAVVDGENRRRRRGLLRASRRSRRRQNRRYREYGATGAPPCRQISRRCRPAHPLPRTCSIVGELVDEFQ